MQNNDQILEAIEHYLGQIGYPEEPGRLYAPISYSLTMSGKRLRPMLLMLTCGIFSDQPQAAMPAAAAVEVFHNFTLLHDDIMDNAAMRRGNPSVFAKWGQNVAILSGDAMLISAYRLLSEYPPQVLPQILARFNTMAIEVCEGQQYDMDFETRESVSVEEYLHMIELKTSALLSGATVIGAIIGGAGEEDCQRLYRFATELGLAFQLQDDLLDSYGDERLGKAIGGDILEGKKTYLMVMALSKASAAEHRILVHSPMSSRKLYLEGQGSIPSDTACFPAKLAHGHIEFLAKLGVDAIFYPCMTYNIDEGLGQNHYNCPVVAYYPEVLAGNCDCLKNTKFIYDYVGIHRPHDFEKKITAVMEREFGPIPHGEIKAAVEAAYAEYDHHMKQIREKGAEIMAAARKEGRRIIVLAGRPYHVDPEVNHGIDTLITQFGAAVITEDSVSQLADPFKTTVLNQWTYHARLYAAAKYCCSQPDMDLVQLVSFGCGVDAITTDETREILREGGKLYTQLKIDEITNLGAVRIRLRSLFAALEEQEET